MKTYKHILWLCLLYVLSTATLQAQQITQVEYWFGNKFSKAITKNVSYSNNTASLNIPFPLIATGNRVGEIINYRFKDSRGNWSGIYSQPIVPKQESNVNNSMVVEYWFDDNFTQRKQTSLPDNNSSAKNWEGQIKDLPVPANSKQIHYRFKSIYNIWSPIVSRYLNQNDKYNLYSKVEYWFDNDFANRKKVPLAPLVTTDDPTKINLLSDIKWERGKKSIHYRLVDNVGRMTSVFSKHIDRTSNTNYIAVQYWFDDGFKERATALVHPKIDAKTKQIVYQNNALAWKKGSKNMYYRFVDNLQRYTQIYHYNLGSAENHNNKITGVEYWFNDRFAQRTKKEITDQTSELFKHNELQEVTLPKDSIINLRYKDALGNWSGISSFRLKENAKKFNIVNLEPNINALIPNFVKEYSTVFYHYKIIDGLGKPAQGVKILAELKDNKKVLTSTVSDESGIVRLSVPTYGKSITDKSDDLIPVFNNDLFSFKALKTSKDEDLEVVNNDFKPQIITVMPYKATSRTGKFMAGVSKGIDKIIKADFGANAGVSFTYNFDKLGTIEKTSIEISTGAKAEVKKEVKKGEKGEVKDGGKRPFIDYKLNFRASVKGVLKSKITATQDYRLYLMAFYNIFASATNPIYKRLGLSENNHYMMSAIASLLDDEENSMNFKIDRGFGTGFMAGAGVKFKAPLKRFENNKNFTETMDIPIDVAASIGYTYNQGTSLDSKSSMIKYSSHNFVAGIKGNIGQKYEVSEKNRVVTTFEKTALPLPDITGGKISASYKTGGGRSLGFSLKKEKYEGLKHYDNIRLSSSLNRDFTLSGKLELSGEIVGATSGGKNIDIEIGAGVDLTHSRANSLGADKTVLRYIEKSEAKNKPLSSFLSYANTRVYSAKRFLAKNVEKTVEFINKEQLTRPFKQTEKSLKRDLTHTLSKRAKADLSVKFPIILGKKYICDFNTNLSLSGNLPLYNSYYHAKAKQMLPTVMYQDVNTSEMYVDKSVADFFGKMKKSLSSVKDILAKKIKQIGKRVVKKIQGVRLWFSNKDKERLYARNLSKYKQLARKPQKNKSIATFEIPANGKAFETDTEFTFEHYYPGGDVLGETVKKDTIVIISDVFYLRANLNKKEIQTAPKGSFSLTTSVGEDDLSLLKINPKASVSVYYKPFNTKLWKNVGVANTTLQVKGLGVYALAIGMNADTELPNIKISKDGSVIVINVSDNIGIKHKSLKVTINGDIKEYEKLTNGDFAVRLDKETLKNTIYVNASVSDLAGNSKLKYAEFNVAKADDDADGVPNDKDKCPNTPKGEKVDANGCSESQLNADDDNDGVKNSADKCPDTPQGEKVDANGCSESQLNADDDNDGVKNSDDKCPDTPKGEKVDANGCSESQLNADDDNDGVKNSADKCPDTPSGEKVNADGCSASQLDDDNDGVMNNVDKCPNTPKGETVNANGCVVINPNAVKISWKSPTCAGKKNGVITIKIDSKHSFDIDVTGDATYNFKSVSSEKVIRDISAGTYNITLRFTEGIGEAITGYTVVVPNAPTVSAKVSSVNTVAKTAKVSVKGDKEYTVYLNRKEVDKIKFINLSAEQTIFIDGLNVGDNHIKIVPKNECRGVVEQWINIKGDIKYYPNPTTDKVFIKGLTSKKVLVTVVNSSSSVVLTKEVAVVSGKIEFSIGNVTSGIYLVKISGGRDNINLKIVKK